MNNIRSIFGIFVIISMLSACEAMEGTGKDIENVGENVQDAAK